jgi:hypothetical protein
MKCLMKLTINNNVSWLLHIDHVNWPNLEFLSLVTYEGDPIIY